MSVEEEWSRWSQLPGDILSVICDRLNKNNNGEGCVSIHNLRLRSVCTSWRSSSVFLSHNNIPTLIIPPNPSLNDNHKGYFTLSLSTTYLLQSSSSPSSSSPFWLLCLENNNNNNNNIFRALNPLCRLLTSPNRPPKGFPKSISLLHFRISPVATSHTLLSVVSDPHGKYYSVQPKKVLVSSGSVTIVALFGAKLWFLQTRDNKWMEVNNNTSNSNSNNNRRFRYEDVVLRNGQYYAVEMSGCVVSFRGSDFNAVEIAPGFGFVDYRLGGFKTLVESNGALYLVVKLLEADEPVWYDEEVGAYVGVIENDEAVHLKIFKLNEEKKEWETVTDLDNHVFFVGFDCSYSVSNRDFPALITNCVYFLDESFIDANGNEEKLGEFCSDVGVYCLDDGSCGPLANFPDHWPLFLASPICLP